MASRAHVIHDYPFGRQPPVRPRRAVWLHSDEEVVLPRSRSMAGGGALFVSALIASAVTAGLAYAVYVSDVPKLAVTEAAPLSSNWEPDPHIAGAAITNQLSGPALSVVGREAPMVMPEDGWADVPLAAGSHAVTTPSDASGEAWTNDSAAGVQPAPLDPASAPATPDVAPPRDPVPYPNPQTTPPEGFAPSSAPADVAPPARDPENPY